MKRMDEKTGIIDKFLRHKGVVKKDGIMGPYLLTNMTSEINKRKRDRLLTRNRCKKKR